MALHGLRKRFFQPHYLRSLNGSAGNWSLDLLCAKHKFTFELCKLQSNMELAKCKKISNILAGNKQTHVKLTVRQSCYSLICISWQCTEFLWASLIFLSNWRWKGLTVKSQWLGKYYAMFLHNFPTMTLDWWPGITTSIILGSLDSCIGTFLLTCAYEDAPGQHQ